MASDEFAACLAEERLGSHPVPGDSTILLNVRVTEKEAVQLIEQNGHDVLDYYENIHSFHIDVGDPDEVYNWVCRYQLDPVTAYAVTRAFVNSFYPTQEY